MKMMRAIVCAGVVVAVHQLLCTSLAFVPLPADSRRQRVELVPLATAAGGATALLGASTAAHAQEALFGAPSGGGGATAVDVVVAGRNLAEVMYPGLAKIDWVKGTLVGDWVGEQTLRWGPESVSRAAESLLDAALSMDPQLVTKAVAAHGDALNAAYREPNLLLPQQNLAEICTSIAQMLASAGPEKNQAIYNSFRSLNTGAFNEAGFKLLDPALAVATYKAFLELAQAAREAAA